MQNVEIAVLREGYLKYKWRPEVVYCYEECCIDDTEKVLIICEAQFDISARQTVVQVTSNVEGCVDGKSEVMNVINGKFECCTHLY